jgi:hypothetical protein
MVCGVAFSAEVPAVTASKERISCGALSSRMTKSLRVSPVTRCLFYL